MISEGMKAKGKDLKIALITTTIHVPEVLEIYREIGKDVFFIVTGDRKTPHVEARRFVEGLGNAVYYSDEDQEGLGYRSSALIGWNSIERRNIALLEALKYGADVIVSIDDDNIPVCESYFDDFVSKLSRSYTGLSVESPTGWFNVGDFITPRVYHRGFPYELRQRDLDCRISFDVRARVGLCAGMWLGDPDIDAVERIAKRPTVKEFSEVLQNGIVLAKGMFAPVDSQNTAYLRELAPLMMVLCGVGRYDDIWASYIACRVMATTEHRVHYGKPFVWQERNEQNLFRNLRDELYGMELTETFCRDLREADLGEGRPVDKLERIYEHLRGKDYLPPIVHELGKAWCEDVRKVL